MTMNRKKLINPNISDNNNNSRQLLLDVEGICFDMRRKEYNKDDIDIAIKKLNKIKKLEEEI